MPLYAPTSAPPPPLPAASYFYPLSQHAAGTSAALGNSTLRLSPWLVRWTVTLVRVAADVTGAGEAGSKFRIGVYADSGTCSPSALLLDAGQIDGTSATVQEITVSLTLAPGLYWIGGAVQSAPTTQPTMRTASGYLPDVAMSPSATLPATGGTIVGYAMTGQTGALPASVSSLSAISTTPRLILRTA